MLHITSILRACVYSSTPARFVVVLIHFPSLLYGVLHPIWGGGYGFTGNEEHWEPFHCHVHAWEGLQPTSCNYHSLLASKRRRPKTCLSATLDMIMYTLSRGINSSIFFVLYMSEKATKTCILGINCKWSRIVIAWSGGRGGGRNLR